MIEMYIGSFSGGWASDGRVQAWSAHADPVVGLERWVGEVEARHASRWRKARVDLWLSGALARPFLCGPVAGLSGWREAEAFAAARVAEATGFEGACSVRLEDWPGDGPVVATALDTSIVEAVEVFARSRRIVWRSVRPRWAAALDELLAKRPSATLLALAEEDALTLLRGAPDMGVTAPNIEHASTYAPVPDQADAQALWHRLMLSHDVQPEDAWFVRLEAGAQAQPSVAIAGDHRFGWPSLEDDTEGVAA